MITPIANDIRGHQHRIGVVFSRYNQACGEKLLQSCIQTLQEQGVAETNITLVTVPGALEIPLTLQRLAQTGRYSALVALGVVIRGETYHFEIVAQESAFGISSVSLEFGIPIGNGILTTETEVQAADRAKQKGREAALAALELANLLNAVTELEKHR